MAELQWRKAHRVANTQGDQSGPSTSAPQASPVTAPVTAPVTSPITAPEPAPAAWSPLHLPRRSRSGAGARGCVLSHCPARSAEADADQYCRARARATNPSRGNAAAQPEPAPAAPQQAPPAQQQAQQPPQRAELNELRERYNSDSIRAATAKDGLASIESQMARQGLGLRGDIRESARAPIIKCRKPWRRCETATSKARTRVCATPKARSRPSKNFWPVGYFFAIFSSRF